MYVYKILSFLSSLLKLICSFYAKLLINLYKLACRNPKASLGFFFNSLVHLHLCLNGLIDFKIFMDYVLSLKALFYFTCVNQEFKKHYPRLHSFLIKSLCVLAIVCFAYFNYILFLEIIKLAKELLKFNPINKTKNSSNGRNNGTNNSSNNNGPPNKDSNLSNKPDSDDEKRARRNKARREKWANRSETEKAADKLKSKQRRLNRSEAEKAKKKESDQKFKQNRSEDKKASDREKARLATAEKRSKLSKEERSRQYQISKAKESEKSPEELKAIKAKRAECERNRRARRKNKPVEYQEYLNTERKRSAVKNEKARVKKQKVNTLLDAANDEY